MEDREYPHPRALLDSLDAEELRDLADDLALQLASIEIALERKVSQHQIVCRCFIDTRARAAKIIACSSAYKIRR